MAPKPTMERRRSSRLASQAAPAKKESSSGGAGSTGLTSYFANSTFIWDETEEEPTGSGSKKAGGRGKEKEKADLPPNWKKAKGKDGKAYYVNSVTQQKTHAVDSVTRSAIGKKMTAKERAEAKRQR